MPFLSYAQNFEDVLLQRVFGGQQTGFYVDVGAYHPVDGSVTKAFYDRGWCGINIEPGSVFDELAAERPRDINLRMAVLDRAGEVAFFEDERDRGTSHVGPEETAGNAGQMVPCDTLEAIVRAHGRNRPVDFIKIDAEGSEAAVVRSTDWRRLRPRVLLLEATLPWSSVLANQDWEPTLIEHGYVRVFFDGINCFYVPDEDVPTLQRHFMVPVGVLDSVVRYDEDRTRTALDGCMREVERLTGERADLQASLSAREAENARLADERDTLKAALRDREAEVAELFAERGALRSTLQERREEVAQLMAGRDALVQASSEQQAEASRLAAELEALRGHLSEMARQAAAEPSPPPPLPPPPHPPAKAGWRRRLARRMALAAYLPVRPIARPMIWRLRTFMTGGLLGRLQIIDERLESLMSGGLPGRLQLMNERLDMLAFSRPWPQDASAHGAQPTVHDEAAAEIRRLATEMERTLLTLALERGPDRWFGAAPNAPQQPPLPATGTRLPLQLPRGGVATLECAPGDLSVAASLAASGGNWEPHVRSYLERVVQPDWVCADIGANVGAHTLSLAVLARAGRVLAFEADAANHQLLVRNAAALRPPHAPIVPLHLALWDRPGTLIWTGADELAGCSFVTEDPGDADAVERRLRAVVSEEAIEGVELHIRRGEVRALQLDTWMMDNAPGRLDLIKLDVEGAEVRVIRGADETLRRYRPMLLVEYNPACAATYFAQPPDALFRELEARFTSISALEADGTLSPLIGWAALEKRLANGKGWEDLVCLPTQPICNTLPVSDTSLMR